MNSVLNVFFYGQVGPFLIFAANLSTQMDSIEQSRRCPLCSQTTGEYLIHSIRSKYDYRKHYLSPLPPSPSSSLPVQRNMQQVRQFAGRRRQERTWGMRERDRVAAETDKLEQSILIRRRIYEHDLYAKACLSLQLPGSYVSFLFSMSHQTHSQSTVHTLRQLNLLLHKNLYHGL